MRRDVQWCGKISLHLLELFLPQVVDIQRFTSFTQNLLFLLSLCLPFTASLLVLGKWNTLRICWYLIFFFEKSLFCYQLLHVASKVEAGQGFFLLCVILCSFLCLFLFFTSPLFLEDNNMQPTSKIVSNKNLYMLQATATHLNLKSLLTLFVSLTAYPMLLRALRAALLLKQFIALCHYWCMV